MDDRGLNKYARGYMPGSATTPPLTMLRLAKALECCEELHIHYEATVRGALDVEVASALSGEVHGRLHEFRPLPRLKLPHDFKLSGRQQTTAFTGDRLPGLGAQLGLAT